MSSSSSPGKNPSSSSPVKRWTQIAHKFKRPTPPPETLRAWRMPAEMREAIDKKEKEIEKNKGIIRYRKQKMAEKEEEIQRKGRWIRDTKLEIIDAEMWICKARKDVDLCLNDIKEDEKEVKGKLAWVEGKKRKFPYDFPEYQTIDEE